MTKAWIIDVLLAAVAGATIWALSPMVVERVEPWDAESFYYVFALLAVGFALGVFRPHRIWRHYVGVFVGQLVYMLVFLPFGALIVLGVAFLALYSLLAFAGAAVGAAARKLMGRYVGAQ